MIERRKTRTINVGGVKIGPRYPIRIQSMAKTDTNDVKKTVAEIKRLEKESCEIVRVAVKNKESAKAIKIIKRRIKIPLIADIHFDYRLAIESIENGADKIRINPGNISKPNELREIIKAAKNRRIPIRIGLNSGSLPTKEEGGKRKEDLLLRTALKCIKFFEKENFRDIIISLKSSDVEETVSAYRKFAALCNYPFHLGITAAGTYDVGVMKSSIGIGALLLGGIGDTIRVSLTGDSVTEVIAAKRILQALKLRNFGPDIISCPTCGRCQVDLANLVKELEEKLTRSEGRRTPCLPAGRKDEGRLVKIAVMGCEVNGPGEARDADIGVAFGRNSGILFKKGKIIKKIKPKDTVKELIKAIEPKTHNPCLTGRQAKPIT